MLDQSTLPPAEGLRQGAYILIDAANGKPDIILLGTGSELPLCLGAAQELAKAGVKARVVSMPSFELFNAQPQAYATWCCRPASPRGWPWKPERRMLVPLHRIGWRTSLGWTISAHQRPVRSSSRSSGSPPPTWYSVPWHCSPVADLSRREHRVGTHVHARG